MKIYIYIISFCVLALTQTSYAQQIGDLDGIYYQAVAIDDEAKEIVGADIEGKPLYNKEIGVRFTITKGFDGLVQWEETHSITTDKYGLFSLVIGQGTVSSSAYSALLDIPWIDADQFLTVEISTKNDGAYKIVSKQKFMTVPYAFYADDIADDAITTQKILNEEIIAEDIAMGAVESSEIRNETILAEDINTGAVASSEILDESILAEDIKADAVASSEILNESILAEDIATDAIETSEIKNGEILNEDIADGTIDLNTKIKSVSTQQILIGDTLASDGAPILKELKAGTGISIDQDNTSVTISYTLGSGGVSSDGLIQLSIVGVGTGSADVSSETLDITAFGKSANIGDLVLASINQPLQGCILTAYVSATDEVTVSIYNPDNTAKTFIAPVMVKLLIIK